MNEEEIKALMGTVQDEVKATLSKAEAGAAEKAAELQKKYDALKTEHAKYLRERGSKGRFVKSVA